MSMMKDQASRCVVIGDLVGSRAAPNRRALHLAVEKALVRANAAVPAVTELRITVGDEFQGAYATLGAAIEAALRVRLELLPGADVRVGIGRGPPTTRHRRPAPPTVPAARTRPAAAGARMPSTRPCSVGTIWLARCRTVRSDS